MKGYNNQYLFAHFFLTTEWNLLARVENTVDVSVNHIEWNGDSLVFYFEKSKGGNVVIRNIIPGIYNLAP